MSSRGPLNVEDRGRRVSVRVRKPRAAFPGFEDGRGREPRDLGSLQTLEKAGKWILP